MARPATEPSAQTIALGKRVQHAMIDAGIRNKAELARLTGISGPTIGRMFSGKIDINIEQLVLMSKACNVRVSDLVASSEKYL